MSNRNRILINFAHPVLHKSRVNKRLLEETGKIPGITINNLYDRYPDFHIDVKREQELLIEHDIIIWQHPFYWYSSPSIIKEWIDLVLEHGFAYGRTGKELQDKIIFNAISTGGRLEAYTEGGHIGFTINQLILPFRQTATLCNMIYLPPFVVHGTHLLSDREVEVQAKDYGKLLNTLRDGIFSTEELVNLERLNDILVIKD